MKIFPNVFHIHARALSYYLFYKNFTQLELSLNAIHTPTNVLDKVGTRVRWVLHIAHLG